MPLKTKPKSPISPLPSLHGRKITPMRLAKDVLLLMDSEKFINVSRGYGYVSELRNFFPSFRWGSPRPDLKEKLLSAPAQKCRVCAIGALFIAHVLREDRCRFNTDFGKSEIVLQLANVFSASQLNLIEAAFECWHSPMRANPELVVATNFGLRHGTDPKDRLRAIMQNIVDNRGTFRPEPKLRVV